jgi:hypothetical protein
MTLSSFVLPVDECLVRGVFALRVPALAPVSFGAFPPGERIFSPKNAPCDALTAGSICHTTQKTSHSQKIKPFWMQNFSLRPCENHHNGDSKKHALGSRESSLSEKSVSESGEGKEWKEDMPAPGWQRTRPNGCAEARRYKGAPGFREPPVLPCVRPRTETVPPVPRSGPGGNALPARRPRGNASAHGGGLALPAVEEER